MRIYRDSKGVLAVCREDGDPSMGTESQLLYRIKEYLNKTGLLDGQRDWIKKLMHKDGHMVDSHKYYLRVRKPKPGGVYCVHDDSYSVRNMAHDYNAYYRVYLYIEYAEKE
jgi:hypothetical protein